MLSKNETNSVLSVAVSEVIFFLNSIVLQRGSFFIVKQIC